MVCLTKPDGGFSGIVAGDVVRRLARTMSQQLGPVVERATSPHQYAMKVGCECVPTMCRDCHFDRRSGGFDLISRGR